MVSFIPFHRISVSISASLLKEIHCITDLGYIILLLIGLKDLHIIQLPDEPLKVIRITLIGFLIRRVCLITPFLVSDHSLNVLVKLLIACQLLH